MEEEGIFYFFRHTKDSHELVIGNSPRVHEPVPGQHKARWHNVDAERRRRHDNADNHGRPRRGGSAS